MAILNDIIADTDSDIGRLFIGRDISRPRKRKNILIDEHRADCKLKFTTGIYTPWQYLKAISHTIGNLGKISITYSDYSDVSETEEELPPNNNNKCVVCLTHRTTTWIFLPCRHAHCCTECTRIIEESGRLCPICRSPIENSFQIFTN